MTYIEESLALRLWLREKRLAAGYTMRSLGSALGVPFQWVERIENGTRRLDVMEYLNVCATLQCDPAEGILRAKDIHSPD